MSATRPVPTSTRDAVTQLWYKIIGTNGDGMAEKVETIYAALPNLVTRDEIRDKKRARMLAVKDVVLIAFAVLGTGSSLFAWLNLMRALGSP